MSLRNFIDERRLVLVDGRRFIVRKPTVATVELFLELFSAEVSAVATIAKAAAETLTADVLLPAFTVTGDGRAARVLSMCVECDDAQAWPVRALAEEVLSMCDVDRIVESLGLGVAVEDRPAPPGPSEQHVAIVKLGLKFGVTPFEILNWPYEGFLDVLDTLPLLGEGGQTQEQATGTPDFMAMVRAAARPVENN